MGGVTESIMHNKQRECQHPLEPQVFGTLVFWPWQHYPHAPEGSSLWLLVLIFAACISISIMHVNIAAVAASGASAPAPAACRPYDDHTLGNGGGCLQPCWPLVTSSSGQPLHG